jgi:hypothetical protein
VEQLGGAFHLYHMYSCFNKEWLHPAKVVDTTLQIQNGMVVLVFFLGGGAGICVRGVLLRLQDLWMG